MSNLLMSYLAKICLLLKVQWKPCCEATPFAPEN